MMAEQERTVSLDYPCIHCGAPLDDCWDGHRCCDDSDHPYATAAETIRALNDDLVRAALAQRDREEAVTTEPFQPDYTLNDVHDEGCVAPRYSISSTDPEGWGQASQEDCPDGCTCECHGVAEVRP